MTAVFRVSHASKAHNFPQSQRGGAGCVPWVLTQIDRINEAHEVITLRRSLLEDGESDPRVFALIEARIVYLAARDKAEGWA